MLDLAINHAPELQAKYRASIFDERYKFYRRTPGGDFFLPITDNSRDGLQFVSLDESGVIGYLSVKVNRLTKTGYEIEAIHFSPKQNPIFTQDMFDFFSALYSTFGLNRLVWSVIVGNPAEAFYDRLVDYFGVRVVGTFKDDVMLYDGQLYDLKYYEYFKDDFMRCTKENGTDNLSYRNFNKGVKP